MRIGFVEQYKAQPTSQSVSATLLNLNEDSLTSAQVVVTQELLNILVLI